MHRAVSSCLLSGTELTEDRTNTGFVCKSEITEVVGGMDLGLVGLHRKGGLTDNLFTVLGTM